MPLTLGSRGTTGLGNVSKREWFLMMLSALAKSLLSLISGLVLASDSGDTDQTTRHTSGKVLALTQY